MACHHTASRQNNGGGLKEKIKYRFNGLFAKIITKIHTIFFTGSTQMLYMRNPTIEDF